MLSVLIDYHKKKKSMKLTQQTQFQAFNCCSRGGMALGQIKETRNTNDMHYIFSTCHMQKVPALQVEMCCMEY